MLVRYLIPTIFIDTWIWFDTRYSILDTFVVNVISLTYSGATWNDCAMSIYYFSKNSFVMKHSWENEIPNFFSRKSDFFLSQKSDFSLENPNFFSKTYKIRGDVLVHILLFENMKSGVWSLSEFPWSFMPRVTYLQYLTQCGVKPGLYAVVRRQNSQTNLCRYARNNVYTPAKISARMYAYCRSVYTRHLRDPYGVDRHWWPGKHAPSAQNGLSFRRRFAFEV